MIASTKLPRTETGDSVAMSTTSAVRGKAPELTNRSSSRRARPESDTARRILVVDDEPTQLRSLRRILQGGYRVDTAVGAVAAASLLAATRYDAVITDYDMPGYDGVWLLEQVARMYPRAQRVLISGSGGELFAPHVRSGLIHRFVPKPASAEALRSSIEG
jgi:DNA-binding NtrC family response regulator